MAVQETPQETADRLVQENGIKEYRVLNTLLQQQGYVFRVNSKFKIWYPQHLMERQ